MTKAGAVEDGLLRRTTEGFVRATAGRSDLSGLDLLVIQIDGIHMDEDMTLVAAVGVDANGDKHPLGAVDVARLPQREILALAFDGPALAGRRHAGGCQGLQAPQGL